jgi:hypothetical protein
MQEEKAMSGESKRFLHKLHAMDRKELQVRKYSARNN